MKLPFNIRYLVLGVLAYVMVLVLTIPAQQVYAYWQSSRSANRYFSLSGINGSVWSGTAEQAVIQGQVFNHVEWTLRPWTLILGKVGLSWRFQLPGKSGEASYGQGTTELGLGGSIDFPELEASIPAATAANMARLGALRPGGTLDLNLEDVEWDGQALVSAEGQIVWRKAGVSLMKPVALGDLTLKLETSDKDIKGIISDNGGPLSAQGVITLAADGRYQFNGTFATRGDVSGDKTLENALRSMGRPGPDGKVRVNYSGNLVSLGLFPRRPVK